MRATSFIAIFILALSASAKHGEGESEADPGETPAPSGPSSSGVADSTTPSTSSSPSSVPTTEPGSVTTDPNPSSFASSPSPPSTSTSSTDTSVPTNALQFLPPPNVTTCDKATLTWEFASFAHIPVTIVVTNQTLQADTSSKELKPDMTRTLSTAVDAVTCEIVWPAVNVPPGQYHAIAFDTAQNLSLSAVSPPFLVSGGSNTTCLDPTSTSANSNSSSSSTRTGSKTLSSGALIGTIAGVLVGVGGLVAAFTLPRVWLRARKPPRSGAPYQTF